MAGNSVGLDHSAPDAVRSKPAAAHCMQEVRNTRGPEVARSTPRRLGCSSRGQLSRRQWIVFDGDVDPVWAENLNSVLDDNKLLTLPNGERLSLPPNVRVMFEVQDLKFATLATVSRCGMVCHAVDACPAASS